MTQPTTDRLAEVLDCDREAWEIYGPAIFYMDASGPQCLARHRIAATQSLSTDLDKAQQRLAMVEAENVRLKAAIDSIRAEASGRDAIPAPSTGKEAHRNVLLALSGRLGSIERFSRAALNPQPTGKESGK